MRTEKALTAECIALHTAFYRPIAISANALTLTEQPWPYDCLLGRMVGAEPGGRWATAVDARPSRPIEVSQGAADPALKLAEGHGFRAPCSERPGPTPTTW